VTNLEFAKIKRKLGLSAREMGKALGLRGDPGRTVRRYEEGTIAITGPVEVAMLAMADGFRPPQWPEGK